jgi:hypothetical protein
LTHTSEEKSDSLQGVPAAANSTGDQGQDLPVPRRRQTVTKAVARLNDDPLLAR